MGCTLSIEFRSPAKKRRRRRPRHRHYARVYRTTEADGVLDAALRLQPIICRQTTHTVRRTARRDRRVIRSHRVTNRQHETLKPEAAKVDPADQKTGETEPVPDAENEQGDEGAAA
ncbi:hypothetical protein NOR_05725 [Metarhizium rileyi]|uniref:Uncharacterized protein n=1 Tax=Metarhizium rileyi (strain RCEF 4871) TaxID=1649241 RepID=A0A167C0E6_METRR|nr:hypothetical protein NOR_05725 [Metarhizium rileyi RCEF 4871]